MRTVVIIDDMLPNALLLKSYMKRLDDVDVRTFTDPHEALALCVGMAPDLVLLDYQMPQMSGIEFLGKFRGVVELKSIPVVMITGEETKETLYQALEAGANDFLRKPVDDIELVTRARNLLELRRRELDLANANTQLYVLATTDQLTNLKNRRFFLEKLEFEVERCRRYARPCSVAVIDADRFKTVNDTYGHHVGDKVLQVLANVLIEELRTVDQIGRLGGEEFGVLFPETRKDDALKACDRMLSRIRATKVAAEAVDVTFTVSAGLTEMVPPQDECDAILKRADRALYRAKELGRDRCELG
jgi:two-component system, cell cycle response regulator